MCKFYRIASNSLQATQIVHKHFDCLSYVCMYVRVFKHLLLWNHWADWSQISYGASMGSKGPAYMTAMLIYGKNL